MSLETQGERVEVTIKGLRLLENWLLCLCQRVQDSEDKENWKTQSFSFFEIFLKKEKDEQLRYTALEILAHLEIEETFSLFQDALSDPSKNIQQFATHFLAKRKLLPLKYFEIQLENPDWNIRIEALLHLGKLEAFPEERFSTLVRFLKTDENDFVRATAAKTLGEIPPHPSGGEILKHSFFQETLRVRVSALYALAKQYWEQENSLQWLQKASQDPEESMREMAFKIAKARGNVETQTDVLPWLRLCYERETVLRIRVLILQTIFFLGQHSREIFQFALPLASDPHSEIRALVANTLGKFKHFQENAQEICVQLLLQLSEDSHENVRASAIWALENFLEIPRCLEKISQKMLQDPAWNVRLAAVETLGNIKKNLSHYSSLLTHALQDTEPYVQIRAAQILLEFGPNVFAEQILQNYLKHPEESLQKMARDYNIKE